MTLARFAIAVGATPKWVQNASAVLETPLDYTTREARRLGLTRILHEEFGLRLERAWKIAEAALYPAGRVAILSDDQVLHMIVDTGRYLSDFAVRLSVATTHYEPARRGRPSKRRKPSSAVERARRSGFDVEKLRAAGQQGAAALLEPLESDGARGATLLDTLDALLDANVRFAVVGDVAAMAHGSHRSAPALEICFDPDKENVETLVKLLARWRPYPRGIEKGIPFKLDPATLLNAEVAPLATEAGPLDVFRDVPGVGGYEACKEGSALVRVGGRRFHVLGLEGLIASRRAAGRPRDLDDLVELEALLELAA